MKHETPKPIKSILPTLLPADGPNRSPVLKTATVRSPKLQQQVNALLTSHSDLASFMQVMNPQLQLDCARHEDRAFFGTAPMLVTLRCAYHDQAATLWMLPQLYDLGEYCGVKDKLDKEQMKQLAGIIIQEFGFLKVTEVMLFLYRFKAGHYGRFYGAMDPMVIMTALRQDFMRERSDAIDRHERAQRQAEWDAHCRQVTKERA